MSIWVQLVLFTLAWAVSAALAPRPPRPQPAGLDDIDAPTAEEGSPIPVVFGTVRITAPNVVWYGDLDTSPIKQRGGKK